jgi:hypothetical protein
MGVRVHIDIFDVDQIKALRIQKKYKSSYEVRWTLQYMDKDTGVKTVQILRILAKKLEENVVSRWPDTQTILRPETVRIIEEDFLEEDDEGGS